MGDPFGVGVTGGIATDGQDVPYADGGIPADDVAELRHGVLHGGEVGHGEEVGLDGYSAGGSNCPVPAGAAGSIGYRDKGGAEAFQVAKGLPETLFVLLVAGWEEFHGEYLAAGVAKALRYRGHRGILTC